MLALVRHGHAGDKKRWTGRDERRPLSGRGWQQAHGLVVSLRIVPAPRLLTSPYLRCRQTLAPLAAQADRKPEVLDLLLPDADVLLLDRLLSRPRLERAVLCTHGETLNALIALWRRTGVLQQPELGPGTGRSTTQKGGGWLVETVADRRSVQYVPPLYVGHVLEPDETLDASPDE